MLRSRRSLSVEWICNADFGRTLPINTRLLHRPGHLYISPEIYRGARQLHSVTTNNCRAQLVQILGYCNLQATRRTNSVT